MFGKEKVEKIEGWKAGVAKTIITPEKSIWMAGYGSRKKPSEGKIHDLYAKALALEDPAGHRLVIVTTDLIGLSRSVADKIAQDVHRRSALPRDELVLTSSHTHTGPVIRNSLIDMYDLTPEQTDIISQYADQLEERIVTLVETTLRSLSPARLFFGRGEVGFAINRREPTPDGIKIGVNPAGPVDHKVPVLRVEDGQGKLRAVVMGYACHNTTLTGEFYQISGDYAGFAQGDLEQKFPEATVLFVMGCGADANPNPRSTLELAKQHGHSLAEAVSRALSQPMAPISASLKSQLEYVSLALSLPTREEFEKRLEEKDVFRKRHAQRMLRLFNENGKLPSNYSYPIQICQLGQELTLVALAGEVVVDYALRLQKELKTRSLWTIAYANDVFAYIPSVKVLKEGGYEAYQSGIYYGMPGPFTEAVEDLIVDKVKRMIERAQP